MQTKVVLVAVCVLLCLSSLILGGWLLYRNWDTLFPKGSAAPTSPGGGSAPVRGGNGNGNGGGSAGSGNVLPTVPGPSGPVDTAGVVRGSGGSGNAGTVTSCPAWAAMNPGLLPKANETIARAQQGPYNVAFFGDSITQQIEPDAGAYTSGKLGKVFVGGVAMDKVAGVAWRLCKAMPNARVFVICIGTNDLIELQPNDIAAKVLQIVGMIRAQRPSAKILVLGLWLRTTFLAQVDAVNAALKAGVPKLDANVYYADWPRTVPTPAHLVDGVHPSAEGWAAVFAKLTPFLQSLLQQ